MLVYFSGHWDVHWGYGVLTHGHIDVGSRNGLDFRSGGNEAANATEQHVGKWWLCEHASAELVPYTYQRSLHTRITVSN